MPEQQEISLAQIFGVVKKSLKLAFVLILVSVIVVGSVLFVTRALTSYCVSTSTITIANATETTISTLNYNKTTAVNNALQQYKEDGSALKHSKSVLENLSINAVIPEKNSNNDTFIPSSFSLTLINDGKTGYSKYQYNEILDLISTELLNTFVLDKLSNSPIIYDLINELKVKDYYSVADDLSLIATNVETFISSALANNKSASNAKNFISSTQDQTFEDVLSSIKVNVNLLESKKQYVINNGIEKVDGDLVDALTTKKNVYDKKAIEYKEVADSYDVVLDKYRASFETTLGDNSTVVVKDNKTFKEIVDEKANYVQLSASAKRESGILESHISTLASTPHTVGVNEDLEKSFTEIFGSIKTLITIYNNMVDEYNQTIYLTTNSSISIPAHSKTESVISNSILLLSLVATALIAYVVAFSKTFVKLKNNGYFDCKPLNSSDDKEDEKIKF